MLGLASPLAAQDDSPAPPLSRTCGVPLSSLVAPAPLTRLAAAIERRTTIHVLAIGSSSTVGIGASTPDRNYPVQLQTILERTPRSHDV
ncbi:MAG TPA: SGNH/GDSL hydrolase family protein, partial [Beijerinckiaceae bacterium]|nr:SGNH/GDSL hydrolase family protein [Beijerinckiaceae bacterium]